MAEDEAEQVAEEGQEHPLVARIRRAIAAHPVLQDQKKIEIVENAGVVRVQGYVFTVDMRRQLEELVDRVAGDETVRVGVESEVKPPAPRTITGRVPETSQGPSNVDRSYSVGHLDKRRRGR